MHLVTIKKCKVTDRQSYFRELVDAARDFCLLIEHVEIYENKEWLCDMGRLLSRLQMSMTHLDDRSIEYSYFSVPDLGERFELYCTLNDKLGESDAYMLEFDTHDDVNDMTGSLAGDFADIYFELKRGLNLNLSEDIKQEDSLVMWQTGYILVWGRQLVNAQKHLFSLRASNQI